jgi:hypothetical protein
MVNTRILFWNTQGVSRKRPELLQFVQQHNVDILLLNETHLQNGRNFLLPNFHSYYTNTPRVIGHAPSAGTAILVNRRIIHHQVKIHTSSITNTSIHIRLGNSEMRLVAVYKSPRTLLQTSDLDALLSPNIDTIIAGDLNSKNTSWNSHVTNTSGRTLQSYLDLRLDTSVAAPTSPTHYPDNPNHRPDVLDIALLKTGRLNYQITNFPADLSSDHSPILLDLFHNASLIAPPKPSHITDWEKFANIMNSTHLPSPNLSSPQSIEKAISHLTKTISNAVSNCTSLFSPPNPKQDLPQNILHEISRKRRLRAKWQRTRDPIIKTRLNAQNLHVRNLLASHHENEWFNTLGSLQSDPFGRSNFFKINRGLLRKPPPSNPLLSNNNSLIYDPIGKAELFADTMHDQFKSPDYFLPFDTHIHNTLNNHNSSSNHQKSIFFSPGEVQETIRKLKSRSAPGPDSISNTALKHCNKHIILHICRILNGCARLEFFPDSWKKASVVMIPKPCKDPKLPSNHRPISLLNTLSKIFERLLLTRLNVIIAPQIRPEQFGFRYNHSTTLQLVNVLDNIISAKNLSKKTAAVLLDVQKAFDKVWHPGLIFKLISLGVPTQLVNLLKSFLQNRQFSIKVENQFSSNRNINAGVPQGSCLSPQLFAIYVNDLPLHPKAKVALFADDTLLYATSISNLHAANNLQDQIDLIQPWFEQWRISINPSKTSAIFFSNRCIKYAPKLQILGTQINWSPSIKYLGVIIDRNLNFSAHVNYAVNRTKAVGHLLFPMINSKSPLSIQTKLYIFKSYMRPILTYASPAWASNISATNRARIEATQSVTLRRISKLPLYVSNHSIRKSTNIPSISDFINSTSLQLKNSIIHSPFPHISDIATRPGLLNGYKRHRPIDF